MCPALHPVFLQASILTGISVDSVDTAKEAVMALLSRDGPGAVLVTLGADGVVYRQRAQPGPFHIASEKVEAVDTTVRSYALVRLLQVQLVLPYVLYCWIEIVHYWDDGSLLCFWPASISTQQP